MSRVKRGVPGRARRNRTMKRAKGFTGGRSKLHTVAKEAVDKADKYAYRDRKQRKRDFRALWIARINAAAREHAMSYSALMHGLKMAGVQLDRKTLAEIAVHDPAAFGLFVEAARQAAAA